MKEPAKDSFIGHYIWKCKIHGYNAVCICKNSNGIWVKVDDKPD